MSIVGFIGPAGCGKTSVIREKTGEDFEPKHIPTTSPELHQICGFWSDQVKVFQVIDFPGGSSFDMRLFMNCDLLVICKAEGHDVDEYIRICEDAGKNYATAELKCDLDHDFEQGKYTVLCDVSMISFWSAVFGNFS
jgi:GTPase SAR1 family protein